MRSPLHFSWAIFYFVFFNQERNQRVYPGLYQECLLEGTKRIFEHVGGVPLRLRLGHASVSFTMDTYAHVLTDYKRESMALMEDLYSIEQTPLQEISYPVVVTTLPDGTMQFDVSDFPEVKFSGADMPQGLQYIKERLQDEKLISIFPPSPTPPNQITLQPGQLLLQIPV